MKSDRQTYKTYARTFRPACQSGRRSGRLSEKPSEGLKDCKLPLARGDIGSEGIAQATFHCEPDELMTRFPLKTSGNDSTSFCHSRPDCHRQSGLSGILSPAISSESYCSKLTMEEVLSRRKIPPDRDIGKYSQKAGNRYREARRSIESPPERDVSISWMTGQMLQRWSRVYSFSSTICCAWKIGEHDTVYRLYSGENKSTYKIMLRYLYRCRRNEDDNHY